MTLAGAYSRDWVWSVAASTAGSESNNTDTGDAPVCPAGSCAANQPAAATAKANVRTIHTSRAPLRTMSAISTFYRVVGRKTIDRTGAYRILDNKSLKFNNETVLSGRELLCRNAIIYI